MWDNTQVHTGFGAAVSFYEAAHVCLHNAAAWGDAGRLSHHICMSLCVVCTLRMHKRLLLLPAASPCFCCFCCLVVRVASAAAYHLPPTPTLASCLLVLHIMDSPSYSLICAPVW